MEKVGSRSRISILAAIVLLAACRDAGSSNPAPSAGQTVSTYPINDSLFGAVVARARDNCLQTVARLEPGTRIQFLLPDREVAAPATVGERHPECGDGVSDGRNAYLIETYDLVPGDFAIALLAPDVPVRNSRTDIDGDGVYESYRFCTSAEGVHFTVWAGEWFEGRRLWHDYYYLGYDMSPTCTESETAPV